MAKKFIIAAVKDELTGTFLQPIFAESEGEILRIFKHSINNIPLWRSNAADYSLYQLGSFDDTSGELSPWIEKLANGPAVKEEKNDL